MVQRKYNWNNRVISTKSGDRIKFEGRMHDLEQCREYNWTKISDSKVFSPALYICVLCVIEIMIDNAAHPILRSNSGLLQEPYPSKDHSSSVIVTNIGLTDTNDSANWEGAGRRGKIKENRQWITGDLAN